MKKELAKGLAGKRKEDVGGQPFGKVFHPKKEEGTRKEGPKEEGLGIGLKEMIKAAKVLFSVAGVVFGAIGIIGVIVCYFVASSIVDDVEGTMLTQLDGAVGAVEGVEGTVSSFSEAVEEVPRVTDDMKGMFSSFENSSVKIADALEALADSLDAIPPAIPISENATDMFRSGGAELRASADEMSGIYGKLDNMSAGIIETTDELKNVKGELRRIKNDLLDAEETMEKTFSSLRLFILIGTAVLILFFLALIAYSIPTAL